MKQFSISTLLVALIFFLTNSRTWHKNIHKSNSKPVVPWTGTISLTEITSGELGRSEKHVEVSFTNALPTLYREDTTTNLDFTDDKGTGTASYHGEAIIGGKLMSTTDCRGSGPAELHEVVIDEENKTYRIAAIGPACKGQTVSALDGSRESFGPEMTDIIPAEQPLGADHNVLSGTETIVRDLGIGKVTRTITWHLTSKPIDVELIVTPVNYDNWLPEPGMNELTKGSVIKIQLKLQGKNGKPLVSKAKSFELRLSNTSREPGLTINYPLNAANPDDMPDLRFLPQVNGAVSEEFQFMEINSKNGINDSASIAAFDGGGWTTLTATAILEDNTRIEGNLLGSGGGKQIPIPKNDFKSVIGTAWLKANGFPNEMDDEETSRANQNKGDGLTAYEEYRGVMAEGKFRRLDPKKKELGVRVLSTYLPLFSEGLDWFKNGSDIDVVIFNFHEIGSDRGLNKNASRSHNFDQRAIPLEKGNIGPNIFGKCYTISGDPAIPAETKGVVIDVDQTNSIYAMILNARGSLPYTAKELLASTIAHELSHGVHVAHHGDLDDEPSPQIATNNSYQVFDTHGLEITQRPDTIKGNIGIIGNQASGDLSCIMAYNPYYEWAFRQAGNRLIFHQVPLLPMGRNICTKKTGSGINSPPGNTSIPNDYFGNATEGNCLSQIRLK